MSYKQSYSMQSLPSSNKICPRISSEGYVTNEEVEIEVEVAMEVEIEVEIDMEVEIEVEIGMVGGRRRK